jgi:hypothetical protein
MALARAMKTAASAVAIFRNANSQLSPTGLAVNPQLSAHTFSPAVIIRTDTSDSPYERTAGASFYKSCLAAITQ